MTKPTLLWLRRDLRLTDHPALNAALARGGPVIAVFIQDDSVTGLGAAAKFRLGLGLAALAETLRAQGQRLILRRGPAREVLEELLAQTGADAVYWSRLYDPQAIERDSRIKSALRDNGVEAQSFSGHLLFEPWEVETGQGSYYKVYSPMWRAVKDREVSEPLTAPADIPPPEQWPESETLEDWALGAEMRRGAQVVGGHVDAGERAAQQALATFARHRIDAYATRRDYPGEAATSDLSQYLSLGEISPRQCWHAGVRAHEEGKAGAETFLKELVWREFAYHLMYHTPQILTENWRSEWNDFAWTEDADADAVRAWQQGRTGVPFVDAAMREMYVTGRMHNRARMICASYLTKHLMCHWKIGADWFRDCLVDWDPASNAMGWQWAAGCGPDAAPYFRVFNPETQAEKFDRDGAYRRRWIAEEAEAPTDTALSYFDAIPKAWGLSADDAYPAPLIGLKEGRERALDAYAALKS
ncbi:deoxyribodipyrimidine photo-lyase [Pseudooceanicola sediminis]|uniref:Deoxyribodipyrimidine photo-lyase n=1 Tax=Pseudooceanicola sediminis TaxID=2211117 RepID=A0A399J4Y2_9RHOB|nr:deoxyribodipyrimidine photo-lyase [Pseudooceanicola sediminis]KAA2317152.1 deoxyribodipyrimidine photo-lyase [Puniceibacterium sp. HSS470]RII40498.1 deoxyribodipyrimidine photo-lyase [Pseudooceanicola sediminis]|tara:strand:+ start:91601 stop:93016 length:1416 start_codon:yes stop_codon:yes gene_type:complete